jgi:hypothetical protein
MGVLKTSKWFEKRGLSWIDVVVVVVVVVVKMMLASINAAFILVER